MQQKPSDPAAHYLAMAHATYDLAEKCDDAEMLEAYLDLAAKWLRKAESVLLDPESSSRT